MVTMKHMIQLALTAVLGTCATVNGHAALPADDFDVYIESPDRVAFRTYADSPNWKFFRTAAYCYASEENERGVLLLGFDRRRNRAHVGFWNKSMQGYSAADMTNFELVLVNIIPGVGIGTPNRHWGSNRYVVAVNEDGQRVFNTKLNGSQVLSSFSRFDRLVFVTMDGAIAQNFALGRTVHAMDHLRTCTPGV